jgi:hypothetical protein
MIQPAPELISHCLVAGYHVCHSRAFKSRRIRPRIRSSCRQKCNAQHMGYAHSIWHMAVVDDAEKGLRARVVVDLSSLDNALFGILKQY